MLLDLFREACFARTVISSIGKEEESRTKTKKNEKRPAVVNSEKASLIKCKSTSWIAPQQFARRTEFKSASIENGNEPMAPRSSSSVNSKPTNSLGKTLELRRICTCAPADKQRYNNQEQAKKMRKIQNSIVPTGAPAALLLLLPILLLQLLTTTKSVGLKVSVSIPELVKLNDAFWLNCSHSRLNSAAIGAEHHQSLSGSRSRSEGNGGGEFGASQTASKPSEEDIYAIKWYKDDEEFYRFLPNAQPKVSIYETNGIQLDRAKSHEGNVLVSKADVNSEGNYRCEVLSEAPLFETVRKTKLLKVYALPVRGPRIELLDVNGRPKKVKDQEIHNVGNKIELRCNSAPSKPAARLHWFLNEHELVIPQSNNSSAGNAGDRQRRLAATTSAGSSTGQQLGYDVRFGPIEYRQHYKGIYSSHSTLTLLLKPDDLINNKIVFKCTASMRQEVAVRSKQLIVLSGSTSSSNLGPSEFRARRSPTAGASSAELIGVTESEAHVYHRQRPQHQRHGGLARQFSTPPSLQSRQSQQKTTMQTAASATSELISNLQEDPKNMLMYIYENADSTLGSSIIDGPDNLENYLRQISPSSVGMNNDSNNNYQTGAQLLEFNRADNLEYIQLMRERSARQRTYPNVGQQTGNSVGGGGSAVGSGKRAHGSNSVIKSPLYLDENDPLRPIINWPPLGSDKLTTLPPGNTIVAISTPSNIISAAGNSRRFSSSPEQSEQQRFVLPNTNTIQSGFHDIFAANDAHSNELPPRSRFVLQQGQTRQQIILERLAQHLNCTCTDGSIDTKLAWLINDSPLDPRDTRYYPTRISPDHRQTWITIGLQVAAANDHFASPLYQQQQQQQQQQQPTLSSSMPNSLSSILARYFRDPTSGSGSGGSLSAGSDPRQTTSFNGNHQQTSQQAAASMPAESNHIKFICQAIHSMPLYSKNDQITFDFNPSPPSHQVDGNSIDKLAPLPSNVIQATSASQSSSAQGGNSIIIYSIGSQQTSLLLSLLFSSIISSLYLTTTQSKRLLVSPLSKIIPTIAYSVTKISDHFTR